MRRLPLVSVAAALFLLGAGPQAQQPGTQFRSGVTLVTIDVTVLDKDGRPVADLAAKDFEVKLNGRVQAIRTATFLQASAESEMSGAVGPTFDAVTPAVPVTGPAPAAVTPRLFVVLVDDLSFAPQRGRALFAATERFVTSLPATDRVGLTTTTGTTTINPATDRAPITATLKTITGNYSDPRSSTLNGPATGKFTGPDQSMGIAQALAIDRGDSGALEEALVRECFGGDRTAVQRQSLAQIIVENQCASALQNEGRRIAAVIKQTTEQQLRGYASVIRAMQLASGLKHLVLLTDGVGLTQDTERLGPVARAAAEAGVQVSVLMEKADMSLSDQGRRDMGGKQTDVGSSQRRREDDAMFLNGARTVADTVGAVFHNIVGTPDPFFERVRMAATAVYRLAVEAPDDTVPGKDFALAARVKREGLTVVANRRAVAASPAPVTAAAASPRFAEEAKKPLTVAEQLQRAIATGRAPGGLEITLARAVRRAEDPAQVVVDVSAEIPASSTGPFDTVLGIVDERGAIRTAKKQVEAPAGGGPNRLEFSVPLAPGSYKLRFAAADASGAVGIVESAVEARLTTMGAIATSELMRWTVNAEGEQRRVAGEQVPQDAKTLLVALELYPPGAAAPADLLVKIAMAPQGSDAVTNERIVTPELRDGALIAEAEYMLDRLTPGIYTIRATVMSGATALGTVSTIVRR